MATHKLYIQQLRFDGLDYTKGALIDSYTDYRVVCKDFPIKIEPEVKDIVTKDFKGSHGLDAYIPDTPAIKDYEMEVEFLYVGTHGTMRTDITNFVKFLRGRNTGAIGSRLAIYDEFAGMGRKDLSAKSVEYGTWWDVPDADSDAIATFKVKFQVFDPVTDIIVVNTGTVANPIYELSWNVTDPLTLPS